MASRGAASESQGTARSWARRGNRDCQGSPSPQAAYEITQPTLSTYGGVAVGGCD